MQQADAERRAQQLAQLYDDFEWLKFYLKCVHRLPEGRIQLLVETAASKRSPKNYFKAAARKEMNDAGE